MSLMAFPSSSLSSHNWSYNVFASFHGPDVRKTLLSHMCEQFKRNGITMFDDQGIGRSEKIAPSRTEGIRKSRISIVILDKKYASSNWCLDELVEILECKKAMGQIVMTIFYEVDPSDVRKQTGEFGISFNETCKGKTEEKRQKWSKALTDVGNIAGEDFFRWDNEANMIKKIARDVSNKLNATVSREFDGMVGLEAHLREMESLLDLDYVGVKMVGISGPAGIGKTTISRALQSRLSNRFQLTCFVDNLRGSYLSGQDELRLKEQFLSNILNPDGLSNCHSDVIEKSLCKQRVLIILDDVNNIRQLMVLANETTWFGPGSRIIVTTENKELLKQHGINNMYHVGFPSDEQAVKILCRSAFRKNSMYHGFEELAKRVTKLCGYLPLGLCVVGKSLQGKNVEEWGKVIHRLETILHRDIGEVLRVGYESLDENEQTLFLHIAVFFNYKDCDLVKTMFADSDLQVNYGLKILENRSLIEISTYGEIIVMHRLLQQVGKKAIDKQEPSKRRILMDAPYICDVLQYAIGTRAVSGISLDTSGIYEVSISKKAFKRMPNLRFLKVYKSRDDGNDIVYIPEEMEFPRGLRLLDWEAYPSKSLPPTFNLDYLVQLCMQNSKLEKLWEGTQPLKNLKTMNLAGSSQLKELPDLSNARKLEDLNLYCCESLEEIPPSCSHLHKLQHLTMSKCINLKVIPADMNLASLESISMDGCSRLRNIPFMSTSIRELTMIEAAIQGVPASISLCSSLELLIISKSGKLKEITHLPTSLRQLDVSYSDIQRISDCIKPLHRLNSIMLYGCRRLTSLPELPSSLKFLMANDCESLVTIFYPLNTPNAELNFTNCLKLGQQARRAIIQRSFLDGTTILPGREVPAEFDHRGKVNSLTIRPDGNMSYTGFAVCLVISPNTCRGFSQLSWRRIIAQDDGYPVEGLLYVGSVSNFRTEHLFIVHSSFLKLYTSQVSGDITFEFSSKCHDFNIIECGAMIFTEEGSYESGLDQQVFEEDIEFELSQEAFEDNTEYNVDPTNLQGEKHIDCWSWLFVCFDLSHFVRNIRTLVSGRRPVEAGS